MHASDIGSNGLVGRAGGGAGQDRDPIGATPHWRRRFAAANGELIPGCALGRSDMLSEDSEQRAESCELAVSA